MDDLPDFAALSGADADADADAELAARLARLQARVVATAAATEPYAVARAGRTRLLQEGVLSERRTAGASVPREVFLFNDALVAFSACTARGAARDALQLAWELPLHSACVRDRLAAHDALAWDVRCSERAVVTLEAPDATAKLSWWHTLAAALADAAPPGARYDLHRTLVRGTLWSAAAEGDEAAARELVRYTLTGRQRGLDAPPGAARLPPQPVTDIDAVDDDGCTALHLATSRGDCALMTLLLEAGASPESVNGELDSPLHVACARGHAEGVALLVANGAPPSMRNLLEQTPLSVALTSAACASDPPALRAIVGLLLSYGADAAAPDSEQLTALHRVALLCARADDRPGAEALGALVGELVRAGCDPAARALLRVRDEADEAGGAASGEQPPPPQPLQQEEGYTPLHLACGAPVEDHYLPVAGDDDEDDEEEEDEGGEGGNDGDGGGAAAGGAAHAPAAAARRVTVELIAALAEQGCPVNARTAQRGETPLHLLLQGLLAGGGGGGGGSGGGSRRAARRAALRLSAVQRLVALGARWDIPDAAGVTAGALAERVPGGLGGASALEALSQRYAALEAPDDALSVGDKVARALPRVAAAAAAKPPPVPPASGAAGASALGGLGKMFGALSLSKAKLNVAKLESGLAGGDVSVELCALCAARFSLVTRRRQCRRCRATVCGACSSKRFPLALAVLAAAAAGGGGGGGAAVDSDDDDAAPPPAPGARQPPTQQLTAKFAAGLSALQAALAPPAGGGAPGGAMAAAAAAGAHPPHGRHHDVGAALLKLSSAGRVCDPCFLLLSSATAHALAEARAFALQRDVAMRKAVNFNDFSGGNSGGAPAARRPAMSAEASRAALLGPAAAAGVAPAPAPPHIGRSTARSQHAKVAGQAGALQATLAETQARLGERGERLSRLQDRSAQMAEQAGEFASLAAQLKAKSKWGF